MKRFGIIACAAIVLLLGALHPSPALAYGGDTHYYLRFVSALETCFTWDEAHLLASADYLVDKNRTTTAEKQPFKTHNKINWHAFSRSRERFNELWERVLAEKDPELQLVKLGQFTHFATDWESHYGYGVRMGHGVPTIFARDPDSLGNDEDNNLRMIDQTVYHMLAVCQLWGREVNGETDPDRAIVRIALELQDEPIMQTLFETNTPRWKKWGKRWKQGKEILARNHLLAEEMIQRRATIYPDRDIPEDFTPGDPEKGLPPPIGVRYDKNGELIAIYGVQLELTPEYGGSELSLSEQEELEDELETDLVDDLEQDVQHGKELDLTANVELSLQDANITDDGWSIEVEIENLGSKASEAGDFELYVLDVASEELLGRTTVPIPALEGGETFARDFAVAAEGQPIRRVLIGATLQINDLSADNNDVWFVPWRDAVAATERKKKKKKQEKKRGAGTIELLGKPKMWVDEHDDGWLMISAFVTGGDSSRRLGALTIRLGELELEVADTDDIWWSVPDLKRRIVPGRTGIWLPTIESACTEIAKDDVQLEVTITGENVVTAPKRFELTPEFVEDYREACGR